LRGKRWFAFSFLSGTERLSSSCFSQRQFHLPSNGWKTTPRVLELEQHCRNVESWWIGSEVFWKQDYSLPRPGWSVDERRMQERAGPVDSKREKEQSGRRLFANCHSISSNRHRRHKCHNLTISIKLLRFVIF